MTTTQGRLESIYPALLAIVNNIAPYVRDLQRATSSKLLDLFAQISSPKFLLEREGNHHMLQMLLQAMNGILEHQYEGTSCHECVCHGWSKCSVWCCSSPLFSKSRHGARDSGGPLLMRRSLSMFFMFSAPLAAASLVRRCA